MERSVLVTGAGGCIGRAVCQSLEASGWQVWRHTRRPSPGSIAADLCKSDALELAAPDLRPAAVIHLAAVFPGVPDSEQNPRANEQMLTSLMHWMKPRGIATCLLASSSAVYGTAQPPCTEDTGPLPQGWYAEGKLVAERALADGPWRTISLRISAPYGPHPAVPTVVHRFLKMAADGEDLPLWGTGARTQHFVHVADVARAFLLALEGSAAGVFNIAGPAPVSMAELATAAVRVTRSQSQVRCAGDDPQEAYRGCFPWDNARAAFGYEPAISLEEGLGLTARGMGLI